MTVDIIAGARSKEDRCASKILGRAPPSCGDAASDGRLAFGIIAEGLRIVRRKVAGCDGVNLHVIGRPFVRKCFRQTRNGRSEEHTSELQSRGHLVCRLLLEKKKHNTSANQ